MDGETIRPENRTPSPSKENSLFVTGSGGENATVATAGVAMPSHETTRSRLSRMVKRIALSWPHAQTMCFQSAG